MLILPELNLIAEFPDLVKSIAIEGQKESILIFKHGNDEYLTDGLSRYYACQLLNAKPRFRIELGPWEVAQMHRRGRKNTGPLLGGEESGKMLKSFYAKRYPVRAIQWFPDPNFGVFGELYRNVQIGTDAYGVVYTIMSAKFKHFSIRPGDYIVDNKIVVSEEDFKREYKQNID